MPLNVRRFCTSVLLVLVSLVVFAGAQSLPQTTSQVMSQTAPTSGDVMRERISKAKAFIAVRNYNAAIYELENIRRETADPAVQGVVNVLLMNSYLEQGDFKRAQDFLNEAYAVQKTTKPNAAQFYNAVASQVVKGARSRAERYRALGLSVSDRTLPLEASNDLDRMRETLELVITQSKEIAKDTKKTADAMMLVEEASTSRSMLARDDYDARRWKDGIADAREELASSRTVVLNVVNDTPADKPGSSTVAANTQPAAAPPVTPTTTQPVTKPETDNKPAATREREVKPADDTVAKSDKPVYVPSAPPAVKETPKQSEPQSAKPEAVKDGAPLDVGSLVGFATKQSPPIYPQAAKTTRTTGIVKVEVTVDEKGEVSDVQKTSGPMMLQGAAKDAIRKWKFKPFVRDGQPVRATGFVSFNFAL
jgi:TonB family protein